MTVKLFFILGWVWVGYITGSTHVTSVFLNPDCGLAKLKKKESFEKPKQSF